MCECIEQQRRYEDRQKGNILIGLAAATGKTAQEYVVWLEQMERTKYPHDPMPYGEYAQCVRLAIEYAEGK